MAIARQLPLSIALDDDATLDNFLPWGPLDTLYSAVRGLVSGESAGMFIWGGEGTGKSHLMQAICAASADGRYLPLSELIAYPAEMVLESCEVAALCALDDVHSIAGKPDWQEGLFNLFNRRRDAGLPVVVSASQPPAGLNDILPDLVSRFASLPVFNVPRPDEADLIALFRFRAKLRGISLSEEVARHVLRRAPRSMRSLMQLLDQLDTEALARGRPVTIPLIRELKLLSPDQ